MRWLYNISVWFYSLAIRLSSRFNRKAGQWVQGRKNIFKRLAATIPPQERIIWFHCASLGEFEQGRPVLEAMREQFPDHKILLTFFSPSGYEVRKDYPGADYIFYLPADTPRNARRFISITRPRLAVFVKYEFWFNYINELSKHKVPLLMISVIFRPSQHFFKIWGRWPRRQLQKVTHFFVQNEASRELLASIRVFHAEVGGDTRFDRVLQLASEEHPVPGLENFSSGQPLLVAGSTWPADEDVLQVLLEKAEKPFRLVVAPHEVNKERIARLEEKFAAWNPVLLSRLEQEANRQQRVLIVDSIGWLSRIYRYGQLAYIGGGFGAGIHNILEAATYGLPVIFGPNYKRFAEAVELEENQAAFPIDNAEACLKIVNLLLSDDELLQKSAGIARNFVKARAGATALVLNKAKGYL